VRGILAVRDRHALGQGAVNRALGVMFGQLSDTLLTLLDSRADCKEGSDHDGPDPRAHAANALALVRHEPVDLQENQGAVG
jgi:hypothetical protein